jgi:hypothetical protein
VSSGAATTTCWAAGNFRAVPLDVAAMIGRPSRRCAPGMRRRRFEQCLQVPQQSHASPSWRGVDFHCRAKAVNDHVRLPGWPR